MTPRESAKSTGASGGVAAPRRAYLDRLAQGTLSFQRCGGCGEVVFYPRVLCPNCGGTDLRWDESRGQGVVYSATTVHARGRDPYNVALVELDEGFRVMSRVEGLAPEEVVIGMPVRVRVEQSAPDSEPLLLFEAVSS